MSAPTVSVIVPHYNDLKSLDICLAALAEQTYPSADTEIIVADNASSMGLEAVQECAGERAKVILATEKGAGPARNAGVLASQGRLLAFTDSDCVPEPGWLESGIAALAKSDIVGGRVDVLVDPDRELTGPEAFESIFAFNNKNYIEQKGFTGSGNLFCPRKIFEAVGPFRAAVSEDVDWSHRAGAKGYRISYDHGAGVGHPARTTWDELVGKWRRVNRESYLLMRVKRWGWLRWVGLTWLLPASIIVHALKVFSSPKLDGLSDRWKALNILVAIRLWRFWDQHALAFGIRR